MTGHELLILEPKVNDDTRGFFYESWNARAFAEVTGSTLQFVQDNHSGSKRHVLRGLHYQLPPYPQGKLVRVTAGTVFDVGVDIRRSSPTYGEWLGVELSEDNRKQLWIPPGFAHGFLVISEWAEVLYKATEFYFPESDRSIRWDDPDIGIDWPLSEAPVVSHKDATAPFLAQAEVFA